MNKAAWMLPALSKKTVAIDPVGDRPVCFMCFDTARKASARERAETGMARLAFCTLQWPERGLRDRQCSRLNWTS
jgi:hypothetical protein